MGLGMIMDFTMMFIVTITLVLNFSPSAYSQTNSPPAPPPSPEDNFVTNSPPASPPSPEATSSTPAPAPATVTATPPSPSTNSTPPPPTPTPVTPTSASTNSTPNTGFSGGAKAGIAAGAAMGVLLVPVGVRIKCRFYFCKKNKVQDESSSFKSDVEKGESALPSGVAGYTGHEVRGE